MTFDIWQITYDSFFEYLFLSSEGHYSSNMDSLEQLFDLGLDDPDLAISDYKASIRHLQSYEDCTYLFTIPELSYDLAIDLYPEYFI